MPAPCGLFYAQKMRALEFSHKYYAGAIDINYAKANNHSNPPPNGGFLE
jgi:hypothetical protein